MVIQNPYDDTALMVEIAAIRADAAAAAVLAALVLADLHTKQLVYPVLAMPVTLPANGAAWTYGALTQIVPINTITSDFSIHEIAISAMSANASFTIRMTYGAGDTEWSFAALTREGAQLSSVVIPVQGIVIPANSVVKAQVADSIGTSTLAMKIAYHLEAT